MSGSTTELSLATAVDSDDNADYLTLSLANSLRTVDALFNSVTGHNHGGAHQGGAIAPAAIPAGSISNSMLGADVARDNLLVNGGLEIWQRGAGPFGGVGLQTADRWQCNCAGTDTASVTKDTTHCDIGSLACAAVAFTLGTGAGGSFFGQGLQPGDAAGQLRGRTVSLSMRVRTSTANAVRARVYGDGTGNTPVVSGYHSGGGAYETLTATFVVPVDATYVVATLSFAASCTAYVDNAMLVVGSQAANYVPMHPADDLARCLRYYEVMGAEANSLWFEATVTGAGNNLQGTLSFAAKKAVIPTLTKIGTWGVVNCGQPLLRGGLGSVNIYSPAIATGEVVFGCGSAGQGLTAESNP